MNLSTRQLRAFVALAEQRSFTRAAAECHLSQPAFSALIAAVEQEVGARLFVRTTRSVDLTQEGAVFEASARQLLADFEASLANVRDYAQKRRGRVSIAVLPSLAAGWLPGILARFHAEYPGIELNVSDVLSEPCIDLVKTGAVDFALAATQGQSAELKTEAFCSDLFHLVCRRGHPLLLAPRLRLKDLSAYPFVHMARHSSVRQYLEAALHPLKMNTLMEVEQLATVMGMLRAGLGISAVPALTLFHFRDRALDTRPLNAPGLKRDLFLIRRADRQLSTPARALYESVMAATPGDQA
ncbi:LysR family transcriptional regulator [Pigmentiphaga soli]|uniref:LysR family transcriptional regulator n=1 Tax=Pigmentiphaga soli TaxID=1007095 RepID=UPI0031EDD22F